EANGGWRARWCFCRSHFVQRGRESRPAGSRASRRRGLRDWCGSRRRDEAIRVEEPRSLLRPQGRIGAEAENIGIPEGVRIKDRWGRADDRGRNGRHGISIDEIDERLLFGDNLLDSVPVGFAFFVRGGGSL